jgi:hypothetical protein
MPRRDEAELGRQEPEHEKRGSAKVFDFTDPLVHGVAIPASGAWLRPKIRSFLTG